MLLRCGLLLSVLVLAACSGSDAGSGSSAGPSAPTSSSSAPTDLAPYVEVGAGPVGLTTTDDGSVWVVASQDETVARIAPGATAPT